MLYKNRDMGITRIKTRKNHSCYGMGIGILDFAFSTVAHRDYYGHV